MVVAMAPWTKILELAIIFSRISPRQGWRWSGWPDCLQRIRKQGGFAWSGRRSKAARLSSGLPWKWQCHGFILYRHPTKTGNRSQKKLLKFSISNLRPNHKKVPTCQLPSLPQRRGSWGPPPCTPGPSRLLRACSWEGEFLRRGKCGGEKEDSIYRETYFLLCSGGSFMSFCILKKTTFETTEQLCTTLNTANIRDGKRHSLNWIEIWILFFFSYNHLTLVISPGVPIKPPQAPATAAIPRRLKDGWRKNMEFSEYHSTPHLVKGIGSPLGETDCFATWNSHRKCHSQSHFRISPRKLQILLWSR